MAPGNSLNVQFPYLMRIPESQEDMLEHQDFVLIVDTEKAQDMSYNKKILPSFMWCFKSQLIAVNGEFFNLYNIRLL